VHPGCTFSCNLIANEPSPPEGPSTKSPAALTQRQSFRDWTVCHRRLYEVPEPTSATSQNTIFAFYSLKIFLWCRIAPGWCQTLRPGEMCQLEVAMLWLLILLTGFRPLPLRVASISAALAKGPWTRPFLRSSNPSARARSTMDLGVNTNLAFISMGFQQVADANPDLLAYA
jgi:hypothetical protein